MPTPWVALDRVFVTAPPDPDPPEWTSRAHGEPPMRSVLMLLALMFVAAPAAAQAPRAAVIVEWDDAGSRTLRETVCANLLARGFEVISDDALDAARAFSGSTGALDDVSAAALRERVGVDVLMWVAVQPQRRRLLLAVRRVAAEGSTRAFGAASPDEVPERVVTLLEQTWPGTAAPPVTAPAGIAAAQAERPARAPVETQPGSASPTGALPADVTVSPPGIGAAQPVSAQPVSAQAQQSQGAVSVEAALGPEAVVPEAIASEAIASEATASEAVASETSEPETLEAQGRTERVRVALVAYAGPEAFGYGAGVRLEIPFGGVLQGIDDSIGMGLDLGFGYVDLTLDAQGNGVSAFQMPGAAYLTWRFAVDDVELGPRLGGVLALRAGEWRGPRLSGERISLVGMGLVGVTLGVWVVDGVQIFGGLDLTIGERVSGIISAGVAL